MQLAISEQNERRGRLFELIRQKNQADRTTMRVKRHRDRQITQIELEQLKTFAAQSLRVVER